jgi:signal transduction histidine kinase
VTTLVFETGLPARIDEYGDASGAGAVVGREWGFRSAVGVPVSVEGRLWGFMLVAYTHEEALPADTEARLAGFAELVATAIANAESQAQLTGSRARIVAAADQARRRIERDLHDGAQQRLVSLALGLRVAQAAMPPEVLAEGGLRPALKALARRCTVPVDLDVRVDGRLPEQIEIAVYCVVSEALTNVAKHAHASIVHVEVDTVKDDDGAVLRVRVRDDGRGGADLARGSGLVGLKDRVEALGGRIALQSEPRSGTSLSVELPFPDDAGAAPSY